MPTQRERDESDEDESATGEALPPTRGAAADDPAGDEDEGDDSESNDDPDDDENADDAQRVGVPLVAGPLEIQAPAQDTPRNRSERRAAKKREIRGERIDRNQRVAEDVGAPAASRRPRVPPRTVSGNTNTDEVPPWAKNLVAWMGRHRGTLVAAGVLVVASVGAAVGYTMYRESQDAAAAGIYRDAVEIMNSPIRAADAPPEPAGTPTHRTFPDRTARSRAALQALQQVGQKYPTVPVAPMARLTEAGVLYDLGRYAEARRAYEAVLGKDVAGEDGRVLEGLGFTLEALHDDAGALTRYEELGRMQNGAWRDIAVFHQARVQQKLGHADRAKDLLHGLIERVRHTTTPNDVVPEGSNGSILEQAQALLRDIDADDPMGRTAPAENTHDPEALMRMIERQTGRRLQIRPPPAGAGAPSPAAPAPEH